VVSALVAAFDGKSESRKLCHGADDEVVVGVGAEKAVAVLTAWRTVKS